MGPRDDDSKNVYEQVGIIYFFHDLNEQETNYRHEQKIHIQ